VLERIVAQHGTVNVLVNNAGIGGSQQVIDRESLSDWNSVVAVNQTGVFLGMREVIPLMRRAGGGSIINFSSIWGIAAVCGCGGLPCDQGGRPTPDKKCGGDVCHRRHPRQFDPPGHCRDPHGSG